MTTAELAAKIAEEIFRTIERENSIVKAEIVSAVERVLAQEKAREAPPPPPSQSTLEQIYGQPGQQASCNHMATTIEMLSEAGKLPNNGSFIAAQGALNAMVQRWEDKLGVKFIPGEWKQIPAGAKLYDTSDPFHARPIGLVARKRGLSESTHSWLKERVAELETAIRARVAELELEAEIRERLANLEARCPKPAKVD